MENHPKISVVIPAFNEEQSLPTCLSALKNQTFSDFEIIVVDNNSTDKTVEIAHKYGVRIVKEKIQGMIQARDRGFREARSDIIARTDADSQPAHDWIEKIYKAYKQNPQIVAAAGAQLFTVNKFLDPFINLYNHLFFYFTYALIGHFPIVGSNMSLRKSAWGKIKVHDTPFVHEDVDIACHLAEIGEIKYCPEVKVITSFRRYQEDFFGTFLSYTKRYFQTLKLHHWRN